MRPLASIAFGILIAVLGYHWLPPDFWDHAYVFTPKRLEGALVAGAYGGVACYGLSSFFDSPGGSRAMLIWLCIAVAGAAWVILQFTAFGR